MNVVQKEYGAFTILGLMKLKIDASSILTFCEVYWINIYHEYKNIIELSPLCKTLDAFEGLSYICHFFREVESGYFF